MTPITFQNVKLRPGRHTFPEHGVCVMELASMIAGERLTDRPSTVSPVVAAFLRGYNDGLDHAHRQDLKRLAADCLGTADGRRLERVRRRLLRAELLDRALGWSWTGRAAARVVWNTNAIGYLVGRRVAARGDDELHGSVLEIMDRLIGFSTRDDEIRTLTIAAWEDRERDALQV